MGRYTVFMADVHGNVEALKAVLESCNQEGISPKKADLVCLGDIVGYGPRPGVCIERLHDLGVLAVMGNHDAAVIDEVSITWFNRKARAAIRWTRDRLDRRHVDFLSALPRRMDHRSFECVHGSPSEPLSEYVTDPGQATRAVKAADQSAVAVGHTHVPHFFEDVDGSPSLTSNPIEEEQWVSVDPTRDRMVINPGSVGQPRDGDPNASYVVWDEVESRCGWRRVSYPLDTTQQRIREAGLPEKLASRLAVGS